MMKGNVFWIYLFDSKELSNFVLKKNEPWNKYFQ